MVGFTIAEKPEAWHALFPPEVPQPNDSTNQQLPDQNPSQDGSGIRPLEPGEFFASGNADPSRATDSSTAIDSQTVRTAKPVLDSAMINSTNGSTGTLPVVRPELLRDVRDGTFGIYEAETEAYFVALKLATDLDVPEDATGGSFALFMDASDSCRGKAYRITGQLRRLSEGRKVENPFGGVMTLHDAWLTTSDSGDQLVHAIIQSKDDSLKPVELLKDNAPAVWFSGFFFKREAYATEADVNVSPLFLAGRLQKVPPPTIVTTRSEQVTKYLVWLAVGICTVVGLMFWSFSISDSSNQNSRIRQLTKLPATASFEGVTAVSISETLHNLEEQQTGLQADQ